MDVKRLIKEIDALEKQVLRMKHNDVKTKYQVVGLFKEIKKVMDYRVPMDPINIQDGGRYFECPKCETRFETELDYLVDDFLVCPSCGQLFKDVESERKGNEER